MSNTVEIFTDGACRGNPGPGGWGVLMRYQGKTKSFCGARDYTTNNQMELQAAIEGLTRLKRPCKVAITTDSQYVKDGITKWVHGWQKNNWKTAAKKPVKNQEYWQALLKALEPHDVEWHWVKGHSDHPENDEADRLANVAIDELLGNKGS